MKIKRTIRVFVLTACGALALGGCVTSTQNTTGLGGFIERAIGTLTGAVSTLQLERSRAEAVTYHRYKPKQGHLLIVNGAEVMPEVARLGDEIRVKVWYSVLASDQWALIPVTETWQFKFKDQPIGQPIRKTMQHKAQGTYSSTYKFNVTPDFPPGNYHILVTISNGKTSRSIGKNFSI